jgi:hypothetical protein
MTAQSGFWGFFSAVMVSHLAIQSDLSSIHRAGVHLFKIGRMYPRLMRRVHREAAANPCDEKIKAFLDELLSYPGVPARWRLLDFDGTAPPFLTIDYIWKGSTLRLFRPGH